MQKLCFSRREIHRGFLWRFSNKGSIKAAIKKFLGRLSKGLNHTVERACAKGSATCGGPPSVVSVPTHKNFLMDVVSDNTQWPAIVRDDSLLKGALKKNC